MSGSKPDDPSPEGVTTVRKPAILTVILGALLILFAFWQWHLYWLAEEGLLQQGFWARRAAYRRGVEDAKRDLGAGKRQLLGFGEQTSQSLGIDAATGLPIVSAGDVVTDTFHSYIDGYNQTIRAWVAQRRQGVRKANEGQSRRDE